MQSAVPNDCMYLTMVAVAFPDWLAVLISSTHCSPSLPGDRSDCA